MPVPASPAPATGWEALGARLAAEIDTLRTSVDQLIAAGAENTQLAEQTHQACMTASEIPRLLLDLEDYAKTRMTATAHTA